MPVTYLIQTPDDSPWTERHRTQVYYTEAYDSLDDFEIWLNTARYTLPPFDLATLFSGYGAVPCSNAV